MNEPRRWRDDPEAPRELRELMERAPRGRALDGATRARLGHRVARFAAIPLTAAAWLSVKSAAALGIAAGVATAGVVAVVERNVAPPHAPAQRPVERKAKPAHAAPPTPARTQEVLPAPEVLAPAEVLQSPLAAPPASAPSAPAVLAEAASATAPGGLAEESRLLEQARRALGSAPAHALELTREHARRFPKAALGAERDLIEIEALHRSGRRGEARALAERLLARDHDSLYAERIERLLNKIQAGQ